MKTRLSRRCVFTFVYGLVGLYFVIASASVLQAKNIPGVSENTIKVGLILDQTGPSADVVVPTTLGIKTYFRYVNDQGGVHGRTIDARVEDDRYSIPLAITAFKKLVFKDKVFSLIGPTSTGAVTVLSRHAEKQKIPLMSAIMPEITVNPFKRYVFIFGDMYPNQMKVLIEYILKDVSSDNPRIAFIHPDNETGKVDLKSATKQLASNDLTTVSKEVLNPGSLDASSQIMNIRRSKADYIVLCGQIPQPTTVLLRELKKFGLNIPVFGSWATCAEEVLNMAGETAKNFYAVNHMMSWYDEGPGAQKMRDVTLQYYPGTEKPYRGKIYTHGWVGANVMVEILKRAGKDLDRENFIDAMETIQNFETGGLSGPINYSPTSHKGGNTWKIFKADPKNGKFIPATGWRKSE